MHIVGIETARSPVVPQVLAAKAIKTLKPYQGLKLSPLPTVDAVQINLTKTLKPYQGLKLDSIDIPHIESLRRVRKTLKPYQGLKLGNDSDELRSLVRLKNSKTLSGIETTLC